MASEFKIDEGVPVPRSGRSKYPWATMEVGQSFFVERPPACLRSQASNAGRFYGRKFICRTVDGGCRVWRTA